MPGGLRAQRARATATRRANRGRNGGCVPSASGVRTRAPSDDAPRGRFRDKNSCGGGKRRAERGGRWAFYREKVGKCAATCGGTGGLWRMTRVRAAFCCEALRRAAKRWVVPDACGRAGNLLPRADGGERTRRRAESRGERRNLRRNKTLPRAQIAVSAASFKRGCRFCRESRHIRALRGCGR